jgi:3-methyladenine DNA glycosylase AlkD
MIEIVQELIDSLTKKSDPSRALEMAAYMKNRFVFLGVSAPDRRAFQNDWMKKYASELASNYRMIVEELYEQDYRELHQAGIDVFIKFSKGKMVENDSELIRHLLVTHSWWDSVDTVSKCILGGFLKQFPTKIQEVIEVHSTDENMWLNRSAILFQLGYKEKTNFELLKALCIQHKHSNEFFIQKAIGWALREYSKVDGQAVLNFVNSTPLKPLSQREAIRLIN